MFGVRNPDAHKIAAAALENGHPVPQWIVDRPEVEDEDQIYLAAFYECSTARRIGMGIGPIPWPVVKAWADAHGFDRDELEDLWFIVERIDGAYLKHLNDETERKAKEKPKT